LATANPLVLAEWKCSRIIYSIIPVKSSKRQVVKFVPKKSASLIVSAREADLLSIYGYMCSIRVKQSLNGQKMEGGEDEKGFFP